jgi:hypothetical protein
MVPEQVEKLKQQYTDQYVMVGVDRPELARFAGVVGQIKTVNMSGLALVEFATDNNRSWYDIDLDDLRIVDKPAPAPVEKKPPPAAKAAAKPADKPAGPKPE